MFKVELICKLITPMLMFVADGRIPELRSSEFKVMMRFWWKGMKSYFGSGENYEFI